MEAMRVDMQSMRDDMTVVMRRLDRVERKMDTVIDEVRGLRIEGHDDTMRTRHRE